MSTIHPGLCASCRHVRRAGNRRGSTFYRCALSEVDPRFPKYPRLPVLQCIGWERDERDERDDGESVEPTTHE
ncbi:MAG TPA: hypothetical protein VFX39_07830 [Gemmatimonadaceae bacterium]|nr:hypothetical protein [Gemmatimonadaceae bacterium]